MTTHRSSASKSRILSAASFSTVLAVAGICLSGLPSAAARQAPSDAPPLFYKFDKYYVNLEKVTHVIDEPGFNMPPGSIQVYFEGNQNWIALFGEEADAFRKAIAQVTTDLTPKKKATPTAEKGDQAKGAPVGAKKRTITSGGAAPAASGAAAPKPAAVPANNDPGL